MKQHPRAGAQLGVACWMKARWSSASGHGAVGLLESVLVEHLKMEHALEVERVVVRCKMTTSEPQVSRLAKVRVPRPHCQPRCG